jgi:hypothetical protein
MNTLEPKDDLQTLEIELLLEGVFRRYGYDFREYAGASLRRRIGNALRAEGLTTVSGLQERVLHDPGCGERVLRALTVNATSMFRDPGFFLAFRHQAVPLLRTYLSFARIRGGMRRAGRGAKGTKGVDPWKGITSVPGGLPPWKSVAYRHRFVAVPPTLASRPWA